MADCMEEIPLENILVCSNEELQAGLSPKMQFIPEKDVTTLTLPVVDGDSTMADAVTITAEIEAAVGKGFVEIDLQVDLNSLDDALAGNRGNKKDITTLTAYIPGVKADVVGFKKLYKNIRGIFSVKDYNGNRWIIGTKDAPAYFDNFVINTGTAQEDNNGGTVTVIANTNIYKYTGALPLKPEPEPDPEV